MNYEEHFLKAHIPQAEKEVACLVDLRGRIALNTKEIELVQANHHLEDLKKSMQVINDLNAVKRNEDNAESVRRNYF